MGSLGGEVANKAMWLYPKVMGFNPTERWGHSSCYSDGSIYVFGGCCGGLHFSDVIMMNLDTMAWNTLVTTGHGPGPRDSHSAVLVGHRMIVFGGTNGSKKVNDLHILDLSSREWTKPDCKGIPPSPRESHTATLVSDDKLVIFGGSGEGDTNYLNDLHVLDLKTMRWTSPEVKGNVPVPRDSHTAVAVGNTVFVYGGDCGDRYEGDINMLDMDTLTWSRLVVQGSSPGVRAGHAAVNIGPKASNVIIQILDATFEIGLFRVMYWVIVYVIGGVGDKQYYNDVWVLDVSTCSWTQLEIRGQQPQGRFSHTAIFSETDIVIYGGCGEDEHPVNELIVLQLGAEHPNGRYNISLCKIFGNHCNQEKRRLSREARNKSRTILLGNNGDVVGKKAREPELVSKQPLQINSDALHPKRKRTSNSKIWEIESEPEEHSLSLLELRFEVKLMELSTLGPEVVSRSATLGQNPSTLSSQRANVAQPCAPHVNHVSPTFIRHPRQPTTHSVPESGQNLRQAHIARPSPVIRAASSIGKEPKLRIDLQGVDLTLGSPGTGPWWIVVR
ncbi:hypothetical protein HYC85_010107 [Camellia sinensis]|uniref:Uncharacterized protein n=1 Tax=Camellia sinensis TaxID=4442 RepID=A0A7J7HH50_CAMSI|nr:hypothetical protein HYC85_010107 [Camellia sinensis]